MNFIIRAFSCVTLASFLLAGSFVQSMEKSDMLSVNRDRNSSIKEVFECLPQEVKNYIMMLLFEISSCNYSLHGETLWIKPYNNTASLWERKKGKIKTIIIAPLEGVLSCPIVISCTQLNDKTLCTINEFNLQEPVLQIVIDQPLEKITAIAYSASGETIITGSSDGIARLWNAQTGELLHILPHPALVSSVACSNDGTTVLTGSADAIPRLWDARTGEMIKLLEGHREGIVLVAFNSEGTTFITVSADTIGWTWNLASGQQLMVEDGHPGSVSSVAFSVDGKAVISGQELFMKFYPVVYMPRK